MTVLDAVQRWEELGKQLEKSIAIYLDTCTLLESSTSTDPTCTYDLVSRINRRLESFSSRLSRPLASAHLSIIRMRNTIVSPVHSLPDEVLLRIFHFAVYSIDFKETSQLSCEHTIRSVYQRIHAIVGVCSVWRRVGLEESFWSLVPIVEQPSGRHMPTAAQLSLKRAPNYRLRLAADLKGSRPDIRDFITKILTQHGPRFCSINLRSIYLQYIVRSVEALLDSMPSSSEQGSIRHLSLNLSRTLLQPSRPHRRYLTTEMLFSTNSPRWPKFKHLLGSLRALQLYRLMVPFESAPLRNLAQLTLEGIWLENNLVYASAVRALALSSQLRILEIFSVFVSVWIADDLMDGSPISFPALQYLNIETSVKGLLQLTLRLIPSGSHLVSVNWTGVCLTDTMGEQSPSSTIGTCFGGSKVDVLLLSGRRNNRGLRTYNIRSMMNVFPTINILHLDSLIIDQKVLDDLVPTTIAHEEPDTNLSSFPELTTLHISRSHCHDPGVLHGLLKVATNHPLEELGIGIDTECSCSPVACSHDGFESEIGRVWESLAKSVPKLRRLATKSSEMAHVMFERDVWRLQALD